jgi:histidine triad (HIT) family protein
MTTVMQCTFCSLIARQLPVSVVFEDAKIFAFMALKPIIPGECLIVPKTHIEEFTDLSDATTTNIILVGQKIAKRMRIEFAAPRIGMLVHGFGVPHAALMLVPQYGPDDLTCGRLARIENGHITFKNEGSPMDRATLDAQAARLGPG